MNPVPEPNLQLVQRNLDYRIHQLRLEITKTEAQIDRQIDQLQHRRQMLLSFLAVYESLKEPD